MQYFRVKNWEKHQHYKDRNPPWIKLHREVLDDYEITCLQDASRLLQMLLWALASQLNNRIPHDIPWLQKRLNLNTKIDLTELINKGFLLMEQDASTPLAKCSPETEAYREETDLSKTGARAEPTAERMPHDDPPPDWAEWAVQEKGWSAEIIADVWSLFREYWRTGKGKNTKREDWVATWRNWCRKENFQQKGNGHGRNLSNKPNKHQQVSDAVSEALADHRAARG